MFFPTGPNGLGNGLQHGVRHQRIGHLMPPAQTEARVLSGRRVVSTVMIGSAPRRRASLTSSARISDRLLRSRTATFGLAMPAFPAQSPSGHAEVLGVLERDLS